MKRNLNEYVNTLWSHTAKGVKRGEPLDRVFAVVEVATDQGRDYLLAWKCTLLPKGLIDHPAFKRPLRPNDPRLFVAKGRNGSGPTAMFRPDSLYRQVDRNAFIEAHKDAINDLDGDISPAVRRSEQDYIRRCMKGVPK